MIENPKSIGLILTGAREHVAFYEESKGATIPPIKASEARLRDLYIHEDCRRSKTVAGPLYS